MNLYHFSRLINKPANCRQESTVSSKYLVYKVYANEWLEEGRVIIFDSKIQTVIFQTHLIKIKSTPFYVPLF